MENQIRIRRDFAPLNVLVSLYCYTSATSPLNQIYDPDSGTYQPDRGGTVGGAGTPCVIRPLVMTGAEDTSWTNQNTNQYLSDIHWYVNGADISTLNDWTNKYSIDSTGADMRGSITIYRNLSSSERFVLSMKAKFADIRTGTNIDVETDTVILSTTDRAKSQWSLQIGTSNAVLYNPFEDKLLEYQYKIAHGISVGNATVASLTNSKSYLCNIPIIVLQGGATPTDTYSLQLFRLSGGTQTQITANGREILQFTNTLLQLDLRLIEKDNFIIKLVYNSQVVATQAISVDRAYPEYKVHAKHWNDALPTDKYYFEELGVDYNGNVMDYPQPVISVRWFTKTNTLNTKQYQSVGCKTVIDLERAAFGKESADDYCDIGYETRQSSVYKIGHATIGSTDTELTFKNANNETVTLIFNE